jgi:transcriptional regulator with GAF, ATPase, and Fis domain
MVISASPLLGRDQETAGLVMVLRDVTELRALEGRLRRRTSFHAIDGASDAIEELFSLVEQVAPTDSTVLILGESGTGKELVADALHRASSRSAGPLVKVNCSALSESLLESELFGHVRGAFTGAVAERAGRFELADGGTLFLDEIGDLSEHIQVKLLRVLQEREIERVGDTAVRKIDVRVVAATHKNLRDEVAAGRFREDLYFRLNVIPILVPPLRERLGDIPVLADRFREEMAARMGKSVDRIGADALRVLMDHRWPGNVRELQNAIEHAVVRSRGREIETGDLPREIRIPGPDADLDREPQAVHSRALASSTDGEERRRLVAALVASGWNRTRTAARLGINRVTLWRRMRRLGIEEPR